MPLIQPMRLPAAAAGPGVATECGEFFRASDDLIGECPRLSSRPALLGDSAPIVPILAVV